MRPEVIELTRLGPLRPSDSVSERSEKLIKRYERLIRAITKPVTNEEARALVKLFGPDEAFGLAWSVVGLVESAPGWPLEDALADDSNEWIRLLNQRVQNAAAHPKNVNHDNER